MAIGEGEPGILDIRLIECGLIGARINQEQRLPRRHVPPLSEINAHDLTIDPRHHRDRIDGLHRAQPIHKDQPVAIWAAPDSPLNSVPVDQRQGG
jgi:hypothetical protein